MSVISPKVSADAPGVDPTVIAAAVADLVRAAVHGPVVPHVLRAGHGVLSAAGRADGVRHAHSCRAVTGVVSSPAHRFFSHARWSAEDLGLVLARLIVAALVPGGAPVLVAVDDTLFKRTGKKVHAIGWFHDGSEKTPARWGGATTG